MINWDLFQGCKGGSTFRSKSRQYTNHINKIKHKNHMVTSVDTERAFDKIQHLFMIKKKTFNSEYICHVTQCNRDHIQQAYSECHTQQWKTKSFSSKIRNKTRMFTLATFILHSIGNPSYSTYSRKRNKYNPNGKEEKWSLFADNIYYIKKLSRFFKPKISIN